MKYQKQETQLNNNYGLFYCKDIIIVVFIIITITIIVVVVIIIIKMIKDF